MGVNKEKIIAEAENELRLAMLNSDIEILNKLLAPELIFTNHLGQVFKKEDDIAAHKSGLFKIDEINPSEQVIQLNGDIGIVLVRVKISGQFNGSPSNGDFRFTRVWAEKADGNWHVIAAHSCIIV